MKSSIWTSINTGIFYLRIGQVAWPIKKRRKKSSGRSQNRLLNLKFIMFQLISFMCFDTKQKPLKPPEPPFNQPSNAANLVPIERNKRSGARWVKSMDHLEKSQRIQLRRVKFSLAITGCKVVNEILSSSKFFGRRIGCDEKEHRDLTPSSSLWVINHL